jgi:hypothetical protein
VKLTTRFCSRFNVQRGTGLIKREKSSSHPAHLLEFFQLLQNLFVRSSDGVICFNEFPAHDALAINHVSSGVRPAFAVRVEKPIAIDHFVIGILKQGKGLAAIVYCLKSLPQLFRILMTIDAYRQDLRLRTVLFA